MSDEDDDRDDGEEYAPRADDYPRIKAARTAEDSARALLARYGINPEDLPQRDEAWWKERDRQIAEIKASEAADAERVRMRRRAIALEARGGFPAMCIQTALQAPRDTPAMLHAQNFRHLPSKIIVFAGGVGTGKTSAAVWLCAKSDDLDPGFIGAGELERRGRYDKQLGAWLNERTSLVIDDLGVEILDSKRVFASWLDEIVNSLYSRRRTLIMTTNLLGRITDAMAAEAKSEGREPEPQFVERYGDRVRSRVKQVGLWADCGMVDLRKEQQS